MNIFQRIKLIKYLFAILFILFTMKSYALNSRYAISIVNHYGAPLSFDLSLNAQVLPDLKRIFTLNQNEEISSRVLKNGGTAYIRVQAEESNHASWSVEVINNKVKLHRYLTRGIAFSFRNEVITFCTPEEFQRRGFC